MPDTLRVPLHPGGTLADTIRDRGTTAYRLSKATGITQITISQIVRGQRGITAETALLLARYFGTSPEFWTNLQAAYDLDTARAALGERLDAVEPLPLPEGHDGVV